MKKTGKLLLTVAMIAMMFNLRGPISAIGVLAENIRESLLIPSSLIGLLTSLPLISFAVFSVFIPRISTRIGNSKTILLGFIAYIFGLFIRSYTGVAGLFIGMLLAGIGLTSFNVLIPSIIKGSYPMQIGIMTGVQSAMMTVSSASGTAVSVPLAASFGWRGALGIWLIPAAIALILWITEMAASRRAAADPLYNETPAPQSKASEKPAPLFKSSLAWQIAFCMGLQSFSWYSISSWLPTIFASHGIDSATAGFLLTFLQFFSLPAAMLVPVIAAKLKNQRLISAICYSLYGIGALSLFFVGNNITMYISAIILGIASGTGVPLAMTFVALRTNSAEQASRMSGMMQSIGYGFAAIGPVTLGAIFDIASSWTIPLIILGAVSLVMILLSQRAGRDIKLPE